MFDSTRSKFPAPLICRRRVTGSPAATWAGEISVDTWNSQTAPVKSAGLPCLGNGNTFRRDDGLEIVISFEAIPLYKLCTNGPTIWDAMARSSADGLLIFALNGASADKGKSPGFTAASTLCQLHTAQGLPSMTWSRRLGCLERLLSVKSPPLREGRPFIAVTIPGRTPRSISTGTLSPTY